MKNHEKLFQRTNKKLLNIREEMIEKSIEN